MSEDHLDEQLLRAVQVSNLEEVKALIASGAKPKNDGAAIHEALDRLEDDIDEDKLGVLASLLEAGANINSCCTSAGHINETAAERGVAFAILANEPELLQLLLKNGFDANTKLKFDPLYSPNVYLTPKEQLTDEWTYPIVEVVRRGSLECLRILLSYGANPNVAYSGLHKDTNHKRNEPAICIASFLYGDTTVQVVKELVAHGASVNAISEGVEFKQGAYSVESGVLQFSPGYYEIVETTALHIAIGQVNTDLICFLCAAGANPSISYVATNFKDGTKTILPSWQAMENQCILYKIDLSWSPLTHFLFAPSKQRLIIIFLLTAKKKDWQLPKDILHHICQYITACSESIESKIYRAEKKEGGGKADNIDDQLLRAVQVSNLDEVKALIASGANPNDDGSAIHEALNRLEDNFDGNKLGVFFALLEAGANVNSCCRSLAYFNETAAERGVAIAILQNKPELLQVLFKYGFNANTKLMFDPLYSPNAFLGRQEQITDAWTYPVVEAARHGSLDCLRILLLAGANPNVAYSGLHEETNHRRNDPALWTGCFLSHDISVQVVKELVAHGASVNAIHEGVEFYQDGCSYESGFETVYPGHYEIVESTALHAAIELKNTNLIRFLCVAGAKPSISYISTNLEDGGKSIMPSWKMMEGHKINLTWSPFTHLLFAPSKQQPIINFLLLAKRQDWNLPRDILYHICQFIMMSSESMNTSTSQ